MQNALFILNEEGSIVYSNTIFARMIGYEDDVLFGKTFKSLVEEEEKEAFEIRFSHRLAGKKVKNNLSLALMHKNGRNHVYVEINVTLFNHENERLTLVIAKNVSDYKELEIKNEKIHEDFSSIVENIDDIFFSTDKEGNILNISSSIKKVLGYKRSEMINRPFYSFYLDQEEREKSVKKIKAGNGKPVMVEVALKDKKGDTVWLLINAYSRIDESGNFNGTEGVARNITENRLLLDKLKDLAVKDDLTALYNRRFLTEETHKLLKKKSRLLFLLIDIDYFKQINDRYGHSMGDFVLKEFSSELRNAFRHSSAVARIGGEEFAVVFENEEVDEVFSRIQKFRKLIKKRDFIYMNTILRFTFSAGLCEGDEKSSFEKLYKRADIALYEAKVSGRNRVKIYSTPKK